MSIIDSFLEISLPCDEDFLKVKETLTRIGISSRKEKKLFQSCHIFHKQGRYFIVHFKELFALDGKQTDITVEDIARRNTIAGLLEDWNLVTILDKENFAEPKCSVAEIKIISHKEKNDYELVAKYSIGKKRM